MPINHRTTGDDASAIEESPHGFRPTDDGQSVQFWVRPDAPATSGVTTARAELRETNADDLA